MGKNNAAYISWDTDTKGVKVVTLRLRQRAEVVIRLPDGRQTEHRVVCDVQLSYASA
jgi:hypothetical protein